MERVAVVALRGWWQWDVEGGLTAMAGSTLEWGVCTVGGEHADRGHGSTKEGLKTHWRCWGSLRAWT